MSIIQYEHKHSLSVPSYFGRGLRLDSSSGSGREVTSERGQCRTHQHILNTEGWREGLCRNYCVRHATPTHPQHRGLMWGTVQKLLCETPNTSSTQRDDVRDCAEITSTTQSSDVRGTAKNYCARHTNISTIQCVQKWQNWFYLKYCKIQMILCLPINWCILSRFFNLVISSNIKLFQPLQVTHYNCQNV